MGLFDKKNRSTAGGGPSSSVAGAAAVAAASSADASSSADKEVKGQQHKVGQTPVLVEKKIAEGGFAVVLLAIDVKVPWKRYALKRQFVSADDVRQLDACKRECQIIYSLSNHKNIISYVDSSIVQCRPGVYEYMLLTQYYRYSVLSLMNERLSLGRFLSLNEILAIFTDMCEAVSRLHHSQTPVIHRDLKVENILIDDSDPQNTVFVLCDFGSATTRVLSTVSHAHNAVEEEILKYTTLSYRPPEMVDLYAGRPITTKADIWAMGVMLYKLCYFALPFGESALAIQNATFSFPEQPEYPPELKALTFYLLEPDLAKRPDIFQVAWITFQLHGRRSPVPNLNHSMPPTLDELLLSYYSRHEPALSSAPRLPADSAGRVEPTESPAELRQQQHDEPPSAPLFVEAGHDVALQVDTSTTSVNPRLRPKGNASAIADFPPVSKFLSDQSVVPSQSLSDPELSTVSGSDGVQQHASFDQQQQSSVVRAPTGRQTDSVPAPRWATRYGFTDLEEPPSNPFANSEPFHDVQAASSRHHHQQRDAAEVVKSSTGAVVHVAGAGAFRPYHQGGSEVDQQQFWRRPPIVDVALSHSASASPSKELSLASDRRHSSHDVAGGQQWDDEPNPFLTAPFEPTTRTLGPSERRIKAMHSGAYEPPTDAADAEDPFGAAPFNPASLIGRRRPQPASADERTSSQQTLTAAGSPLPYAGGRLAQSAAGDATPQPLCRTEVSPLESQRSNSAAAVKLAAERRRPALRSYQKLINSADDVAVSPTADEKPGRWRNGRWERADDSDSVGSASDLKQRMQAASTSDDDSAHEGDNDEDGHSEEEQSASPTRLLATDIRKAFPVPALRPQLGASDSEESEAGLTVGPSAEAEFFNEKSSGRAHLFRSAEEVGHERTDVEQSKTPAQHCPTCSTNPFLEVDTNREKDNDRSALVWQSSSGPASRQLTDADSHELDWSQYSHAKKRASIKAKKRADSIEEALVPPSSPPAAAGVKPKIAEASQKHKVCVNGGGATGRQQSEVSSFVNSSYQAEDSSDDVQHVETLNLAASTFRRGIKLKK